MRKFIPYLITGVVTYYKFVNYQYFIEQLELFVNHFTIKTKVLQYTIDEKL